MGLMLSKRRVGQIFRFHMYIPQLIEFRTLCLTKVIGKNVETS